MLPPCARFVGGKRQSPVGWEGVSLEPVKYVEGDDGVCHVNQRPCLEVVTARKEADQEADGCNDANVESPGRGGVEPLYTDIIGLRTVAGLHSAGPFAADSVGALVFVGNAVLFRSGVGGSCELSEVNSRMFLALA